MLTSVTQSSCARKKMASIPVEELLSGQAQVWNLMFGFADSMVLTTAVELGLADIIHIHGGPMTLFQIASKIYDSPSPDIPYLARILRFLVRKNIFTAHRPSDGGETTYGLSNTGKWLLRDSQFSLAPKIVMENHPWQLAPWHALGRCVREGGIAFEKTHGCEMWDFAAKHPEFNRLFNEGMSCAAKLVMEAFLSEYRDGFASASSVVDVGGGTGKVISEIVKFHPHIKGINFDLPHVIATAPPYEGVTHTAGDMFKSIPSGDVMFMKWVLHDWSDDHCIEILKNCREATRDKKKGKVVIVDIVLEEEGDDPFDNMRMTYDVLMMAHTTGGKERTELEWKNLLTQAGFPTYKITKIPAIPSIIEAFPE